MANKVYIQDINPGSDPMVFPLVQDPIIQVESQFSSFSETFPAINDFLNMGVMVQAGAEGKVSEGILRAQNLFDIKKWIKTDPVKFPIDLVFYVKDKPKKDVFEPMIKLLNYVMLTKGEDGKFSIPGLSLASLGSALERQFTSKHAKIISVWIPGIIYLPQALVESIQTTFSKEKTESGFPLWGKLSVNIESIFPANSEFFDPNLVEWGKDWEEIKEAGLA